MPAERSGAFGYWRDPVFLVCLGTYVVNRLLIKPNLHHYSPLFHGHLNDVLTLSLIHISKIWHCLKVAPEVFNAAHSWVELADYVPSVLAGVTDSEQIVRGVCCAGHKALYSDEWGGLPDKGFLAILDPKLAALRDRLYERAHDASASAGKLCAVWAKKLGLPVGIPIAIGEMDVHYLSLIHI